MHLSSVSPGDLSPFQLVEFGPATAQPSETLQVNCAVYGVYITAPGTYWYWLKHSPQKGLECLGWIDYQGNARYAPSFQSRIAITRDVSKNQFYFQLRSLTRADSARYLCARLLGHRDEEQSRSEARRHLREARGVARCPRVRK